MPVHSDQCPVNDTGGDPAPDLPSDLLSRLNHETAVIAWADLLPHFARGVVIKVQCSVDLVDAAECLVADNTEQLQAWIETAAVTRASDEDARQWVAREPEFWCVVTAPWVLVQEK